MFEYPLTRAKRRVLLPGLAAAAACAGLSATAQDAQAAFTLGPCAGASGVSAQGASFQNAAQTYFRSVFTGSNGCGGTPAAPTYTSNGSSNGIAAMGGAAGNAQQVGGGGAGVRSTVTSFSATDDPPTVTQQATMNAGGPSPSDDGKVHVIPVATGANAVIVRAPAGCDLSGISNKSNGADGTVGGANTTDGSGDKTQRLRIENGLLEKAFAGTSEADTWGDIAPGISGDTTSNQQSVGGVQRLCIDVPVRRIVRFDSSGTTFAFKTYLQLINPSRGWLASYTANPNTNWPTNGSGSSTPVNGVGLNCPFTGARLCSGPASGNDDLADGVNATDGSIGYSDLAEARGKGFTIAPDPAIQDYTFWLPLQNNPGGTSTGYAEPTSDPGAHKLGGSARGANCQNVAVQNVPTPANSPNGDPTLGDWSKVFAAGGPVYGACVLTYILAWDDNAAVYGNTPAEEAKARTVKDFLATMVGPIAQQFRNPDVDYSPLPNPQQQPLGAYAQNGVNAIGWNKTATAGGGGTPAPAPAPAPTPTPNPAPRVIPPVIKPSNLFTVGTPKVNAKRTRVAFPLRFPGAGKLVARATFKSGTRTIRVATVNANIAGAGSARVTVKLSSAARKALKKRKRISLRVSFTFTPSGGDPRTITKTVSVRAKAARR